VNASASPPEPAARHLPILLLLFVGSGGAALIYEIVWFQMLQLVIGSTAVSLGVLLATFMGGMGAGSLAWPRLVSPRRHPLRAYAILELAIGICGALVLLILPAAGRLYTVVATGGEPGIAWRAILCALLLLPPTFLMGATLPVVARWIGATPRGLSWLGFFYGGNTVGAVIGCLFAGFYLLRVHDMATATLFAVTVNLAVAAAAFVLSARAAYRPLELNVGEDRAPGASDGAILVAIGLSGACALAAEVVWTRHLALMLGGTVYTFSIILAVFLAGIGLGGAGGALLARHTNFPGRWLALLQLLLAAGICWAAVLTATEMPYWPVDDGLVNNPWLKLHLDLARCAAALLPPALLWGASFPLALAALGGPGRDAGRLAGGAYAANTGGAIIGSLAASLWLIPALGGQGALRLLISVSAVAGMVVLLRELRGLSGGRALAMGLSLFLVVPLGVRVLTGRVPELPWRLLAFGRQLTITPVAGKKALYFGEGLNSTVGVTETAAGIRSFHVAGKTEASTYEKDMRLQRMLGHIPALLHSEPKSVLIVGMGAGVTAGSFTRYPSIERIVICEIEPLIPERIAPFFRDENYNVVNDPRVEIIYDDARHYILTTEEKFDLITSDPIHPWVKGAATLYTEEYFEHVRERLNPGGLVTQWVPFYESSREVVLSELATFLDVFPEGTIWGNSYRGTGYDVVLLGRAGTDPLDVDALQARLDRPGYTAVRESLQEVGLGTFYQLLATYAGRRADLADWLDGAVINRDRDLRLQYLAGLQVNSSTGIELYNPMLARRRWPDELFTADPSTRQVLEQAMGLNINWPAGLGPVP